MKIKLLLICLSTNLILCKEVVNKIDAIIYHGDGSSLILQSDLTKGFGGAKTLEQEISSRLMLLDAQKLKVSITDSELDAQIAQLQKQNNMTAEDVKNIFKQDGFTEAEGREELRKNFLVRKIIGYRVEDRISVSMKDIEDEYNKCPEFLPGKLTVRQANVSFTGSSKSIKTAIIKRDIESGKILENIKWESPITLESDQVSPEMLDKIKDLSPNSVIILEENESGLTLLNLISKSEPAMVPLEEKKYDIRAKLMQEQYDKYMQEYEQKLFAEAKIKRLS